MFGWMDGHMDGWVETEAGLRNCYAQFKNIKYKNPKEYLTRQHMSSKVIYSYLLGVVLTLILHQNFCKNKNIKINSNRHPLFQKWGCEYHTFKQTTEPDFKIVGK